MIIFFKPERLEGDGYKPNTDIWSLGLTLLECKLGDHPFNLKE